MKIVLFEDTEEQAQALVKALEKKIVGGDIVLHFRAPGGQEGTFEDQLSQLLNVGEYAGATLVVADRDLSKTSELIGLSESSVRRAADGLGIPECSYERNDLSTGAFDEQREACISVSISEGFEKCADQIIAIENGFAEIRAKLPEQLKLTSKKSPGRLLAGILGKPEYAEKISLYAAGDQNRLVDVLRIGKSTGESRLAQTTCLLGYWLWDSILRFPGVVLNATSAASYLNITDDAFQGDVRELFAATRYEGPFAAAAGELWWRGLLDDLIATAQSADGREYASTRLGREVVQSQCCEDPTQPAGYYCMLSHKPVSLKNSHPGLSWFPRGADLARVSNSQHEELGPWL